MSLYLLYYGTLIKQVNILNELGVVDYARKKISNDNRR